MLYLSNLRAGISLLVCLFLLTVLTSLKAQPCSQHSITLFSQSNVDNFKQVYNCSVIQGSLNINGADITNLDSLHELVEVGSFAIHSTNIVDFKGLSSLKKINGTAEIGFNPSLTSFDGLQQLEVVDGFFITNNNSLTSLLGLNNIRKLTDRLWISYNPLLLSLNGLNSLDSVRHAVHIEDNDMLQSLAGLENLKSAGSMRIDHNISLYTLGDLSSLTTLPGGMIIFLNLGMVEIGNLENLEHVGYQFWLSYNPLIESLEGLALKTVTGAEIDFFGGLLITGTKIKNLQGLENLEHVDGRIYIGQNEFLENFDALEKLHTLNGHLGIEDNFRLTSIDGIADLPHWPGELELTDNDSLEFCSVPSICNYIAAPSDLVLIWGNKPGCASKEEILSNCSPVIDFHTVDANLEVDKSDVFTGDIKNLSPAELLSLDELRAGVATDGVSSLLFRLTTGTRGSMTIANAAENGIDLPWGDTTHYISGKNYFFFTYTAPEEFDEFEDIYMLNDAVEAYDVEIEYTFTSGADVRTNDLTITNVRPPVVLVHGTYSNPVEAWQTATPPGLSFYDRLTNEGFKVFAVNYQETNGTTGFNTDNTGFAANAKILWGDVYPQNTGGIKDALTYYRNELNIASTQADVIGHSLGGILPRVYASQTYNPDYRRDENFMEGDINRLITLGSTHFGSHLGELQLFLNGLTPFDIGALDWLALQGVNLATDWVGGASPSNAVIDQMPPLGGTALGLIGRTEVPAHAITLRAPKGALKDLMHDPGESYFDLYWFITTLMYQMNDVRTSYLDSKLALIDMGLQSTTTLEGGNPAELYPLYNNYMWYKSMIEDAIHRAGTVISVLDGTFELPSEVDIYKYAFGEAGMGDFADPLLDVFVAGADPVGVALDYLLPDLQLPTVQSILEDQLRVGEASMEALRSLIFNNDDNDGVVRVQSQSGEIEKECPGCVSAMDSVLHGFAPRYIDVQSRMVDLLTGGMLEFHPEGFPPVDHAQEIYFPSQSLDLFKVPTSGGAAICQSGMVPSHARAFAHVADEYNVIIMTRPVNPDGTEHLANNAATKSMNVKPKSSNWGPQKGFIPVEQRYSKLWKIFEGNKRTEQIIDYNTKAQENLNTGVALSRQLIVNACDKPFHVYIDQSKVTSPEDANAEDEVVLVPVEDPTKVCTWGNEFYSSEIITECVALSDEHQLVPMLVLASPDELEEDGVTPRFLTADYDLLMVGFQNGPDLGAPMPPELTFRPDVGQMTEEQEILAIILNQAVNNTGYRGGKVVHHGPENQYDKSPYIDYPITVFAPDHIPNGLFNQATDGLILSIEMGPPGFRDLYLKQFINRMRKEGYDLYHNEHAPGWKWTWNGDAEAYQLEDAVGIGDYVEQLPKKDCDKFGGQKSDTCPTGVSVDDAKPGPVVPPSDGRSTGNINFSVTPNIASHYIHITTSGLENASMHWIIYDSFGNVCKSGRLNDVIYNNVFEINVSNLHTGMFTVVTDSFGEVGRFVKM